MWITGDTLGWWEHGRCLHRGRAVRGRLEPDGPSCSLRGLGGLGSEGREQGLSMVPPPSSRVQRGINLQPVNTVSGSTLLGPRDLMERCTQKNTAGTLCRDHFGLKKSPGLEPVCQGGA